MRVLEQGQTMLIRPEPEEALPEEPDPSTWRYLNMEPEPGDTLQGEITVRAYTVGSNVPLLNTLANEFMFRHPAVKINVEWVMDYIDYIGTTSEEKAVLRQEFDEELCLTLATGTADYVFFDEGPSTWTWPPCPPAGRWRTSAPTCGRTSPRAFSTRTY